MERSVSDFKTRHAPQRRIPRSGRVAASRPARCGNDTGGQRKSQFVSTELSATVAAESERKTGAGVGAAPLVGAATRRR